MTQSSEPRKIYTLSEVAELVGRHQKTIRRWIESGSVDVVLKKNVSGHLVFTAKDVQSLLKHVKRIRYD